MENKEAFNYTYSAKQQEEIKNIRKKYCAPEEDKMELLRRLDKSASSKATTAAIIVGVIGTLIMGCGMSLVMTDIGAVVGVASPLIPGIILGIVGLVSASIAYPLYNRRLKKERERIAPEIIRLTDELMK